MVRILDVSKWLPDRLFRMVQVANSMRRQIQIFLSEDTNQLKRIATFVGIALLTSWQLSTKKRCSFFVIRNVILLEELVSIPATERTKMITYLCTFFAKIRQDCKLVFYRSWKNRIYYNKKNTISFLTLQFCRQLLCKIWLMTVL